jgi:HJR/Mrr/RecB family endonuclease
MSRHYRKRQAGGGAGQETSFLVGLLVIAAVYKRTSLHAIEQIPMYAAWVGAGVFVLVLCTKILRMWLNRQKHGSLSTISGRLDGIAFEHYISRLLESQNFTHIKLTERYDLGIDIIARKDGVNWGIQVKYYRGLVGADAVRQVVTALNMYGCQRAMVVTNSVFSRPATQLAASNDCELADKDELTRWEHASRGRYSRYKF